MNEEKKQKHLEQMAQLKRQMERKTEIFAEYPEIRKFIQRKELYLRFLILFGAILYAFRGVMIRGITGGSVGSMIFGFLMGYGLYFIFLYACKSHQFKISALSGVLCICNFILNYTRGLQKIAAFGNPIEIYREALRVQPAVAILDLMPLLFFAFVSAFVFWMLLVPKNRKLAMRFEELLQA